MTATSNGTSDVKLLQLLAMEDAAELKRLKAELESTKAELVRAAKTTRALEAHNQQLQDENKALLGRRFAAEIESRAVEKCERAMKDLRDENALYVKQADTDTARIRDLTTQLDEVELDRNRWRHRATSAEATSESTQAELEVLQQHAMELRASNLELATRVASLQEKVDGYASEDWVAWFKRKGEHDPNLATAAAAVKGMPPRESGNAAVGPSRRSGDGGAFAQTQPLPRTSNAAGSSLPPPPPSSCAENNVDGAEMYSGVSLKGMRSLRHSRPPPTDDRHIEATEGSSGPHRDTTCGGRSRSGGAERRGAGDDDALDRAPDGDPSQSPWPPRPSTTPLEVEAIYGEQFAAGAADAAVGLNTTSSASPKLYLVKFRGVHAECWTSADNIEPECPALTQWIAAKAHDRRGRRQQQGGSKE